MFGRQISRAIGYSIEPIMVMIICLIQHRPICDWSVRHLVVCHGPKSKIWQEQLVVSLIHVWCVALNDCDCAKCKLDRIAYYNGILSLITILRYRRPSSKFQQGWKFLSCMICCGDILRICWHFVVSVVETQEDNVLLWRVESWRHISRHGSMLNVHLGGRLKGKTR